MFFVNDRPAAGRGRGRIDYRHYTAGGLAWRTGVWCRRAQAAVSHGILDRGRRVSMTIVAAMVGLAGAVIAAAPARGCGAEA
jgi:hypothetical protein